MKIMGLNYSHLLDESMTQHFYFYTLKFDYILNKVSIIKLLINLYIYI